MSLNYEEQMKFIVYKSKNTTKKELNGSDLYLAHENIPNSKITMYFMKVEKVIKGENGESITEKDNIQVYLDSKRNLIFAENKEVSNETHQLLFGEYEVHGELSIPGKKEATNQFVKKMLTMIRSYK